MTKQENAIWAAAYGAYFAFDIAGSRADWDRAIEMASVECAADVADQAVRELRRWRQEENNQMGKVVRIER